MSFCRLCFVLLLLIMTAVHPVLAKEGYRTLTADEIKQMGTGGKTFLSFVEGYTISADRFHMTEDGKFIQNINGSWAAPQKTMAFTGTWQEKNGQLCWTYETAPADQENFIGKEYCYTAYTTSPKSKDFLKNSLVRIVLATHDDQGQFIESFAWKVFSFGNFLYTDTFFETLRNRFVPILQTRENLVQNPTETLAQGTINKDDLKSETLKEYFDTLVGNISTHAYDYAYYHPDGRAVITTPTAIKTFLKDGDKEKFIKAIEVGQWRFYNDDYYCRYNTTFPLCEHITKEQGLTEPYEGFLGHYIPTYYPRFHQEHTVSYLKPDNAPKAVMDVFQDLLNNKQ